MTEPAAHAMGLQIQVLNASTIREIDAAFATLARERPDAASVAVDSFFIDRRVQLAQLTARHAIPAIYQDRLYTEVGGLMSYGASLGDAWRQVGSIPAASSRAPSPRICRSCSRPSSSSSSMSRRPRRPGRFRSFSRLGPTRLTAFAASDSGVPVATPPRSVMNSRRLN
jgi:hypothetical protein